MRLQQGQEDYPHRFSASGHVKGSIVFAGFGISAPALSYDDLPRRGVKGKIALILDHEPASTIRRARSTAWSAPKPPCRSARCWRRRTAAPSASSSSPTCTIIPARRISRPAAALLAGETAAHRPALSRRRWVDRIRIPVGADLARRSRRFWSAHGRSLEDLARAAGVARDATDRSRFRARSHLAHVSGQPSHRPGPQRPGAHRGQRSAAQGRVVIIVGAPRPRGRRRQSDLQWRGRQRVGLGRASSTSRRPTPWRARPGSGRDVDPVRRVRTPRSAGPCSDRGHTPSIRCGRSTRPCRLLNMDMIGRNRKCRWAAAPFQRARGADAPSRTATRQPHRLLAQRRVEGGRRAGQRRSA